MRRYLSGRRRPARIATDVDLSAPSHMAVSRERHPSDSPVGSSRPLHRYVWPKGRNYYFFFFFVAFLATFFFRGADSPEGPLWDTTTV